MRPGLHVHGRIFRPHGLCEFASPGQTIFPARNPCPRHCEHRAATRRCAPADPNFQRFSPAAPFFCAMTDALAHLGHSMVTQAGGRLPGELQVIDLLARPERFELPTSWFVAMRSIQLSYGRAACRRQSRLRVVPNGGGAHPSTAAVPGKINKRPERSPRPPRLPPAARAPACGRFARCRSSPHRGP